ncbi:MAG: glucosaminidase domain-containing protein [Treponema sp.]
MNRILALSASLAACAIILSCGTFPTGKSQDISRSITGEPVMNAQKLAAYFLTQNAEADKAQVRRLSAYYVEEARAEGINSDVAFAQMCLETGFLRFGNLVTPDMHNYCGLGAINAEQRGEVFENERLGVRAHIQHLHAYSTSEETTLNRPLIDRRYRWVNPRGKAPTVFELAGTWAADKNYGYKLDSILYRMEKF